MRVKIGNHWHSIKPDSAIMVELSDADRRNIANMAPGARFYGSFHPQDERDEDQKVAWMKEA